MVDFSKTIIPKSDQLNADDLINGDLVIRITAAKMGSADQPMVLAFDGCNGRPYKPNLTMRKLIIHAWGNEGDNYVGKLLKLYRDPTVKWGNEEVGGIAVSAMSGIPKTFELPLQIRRGKKKKFKIEVLAEQSPDPVPPPVNQEDEEPKYMVKLASGAPINCGDDPQAVLNWLTNNISKINSAEQLDTFIERNSFQEYFKDDPEMAQQYSLLIQTQKGNLANAI